LSLKAQIHFKNGDKFDPGWYIATDGGDALEGNCALSMLDQEYSGSMRLTRSETSRVLAGDARVSWVDNHADECGDVLNVPTDGEAVLEYNLAINTELL